MPLAFDAMNSFANVGPEDAKTHISRLWKASFQELALDAARDTSDSNVAIVRLVADLRVAEASRTLTRWTFFLALFTLALVVVTLAVVR